MTDWKRNPLAFAPKPISSGSWWTDPKLQTDRLAFSQYVAEEAERITGHQRFGGSKRVHDKFPAKQKHVK